MFWTLLQILGIVISIPIVLVLLLLLLLLFFQISHWINYARTGCNIPAAPEKPFIGSFLPKEFHLEELERRAQFGPVVYSTALHMFKISISDPDLMQLFFLRNGLPKTLAHEAMGELWGHNLFTLNHSGPSPAPSSSYQSWRPDLPHPFPEGSAWRRERAKLNPAFKVSALRALHPIFASQTERFVRRFLKKASSSAAIDFHEEMSRFTLDIISLAGFGYDLGASLPEGAGEIEPGEGQGTREEREEAKRFLASLNVLFAAGANLLIILPGGVRLLRWIHRNHFALVDQILFRIIDQRIQENQARKAEEAKGAVLSGERRKQDLLDLMLEPNEEGEVLSKTSIRNELFLFFVAGSETSANVMSWAIFELSRHPEVLGRLRDEVDEVMGPRSRLGREGEWELDLPSLEQTENMPYLSMVLNETLRLYPPVGMITRYVPETFESKGYIFPKGAFLSASALLLHRDERYWPNPEKFDPERFSKEGSEGRHPFAFFPFSSGPRVCIGKNFFLQEAKLLLATFLRHVDFSLDESRESGRMTTPSGTLRPNAVWISASPRR